MKASNTHACNHQPGLCIIALVTQQHGAFQMQEARWAGHKPYILDCGQWLLKYSTCIQLYTMVGRIATFGELKLIWLVNSVSSTYQ